MPGTGKAARTVWEQTLVFGHPAERFEIPGDRGGSLKVRCEGFWPGDQAGSVRRLLSDSPSQGQIGLFSQVFSLSSALSDRFCPVTTGSPNTTLPHQRLPAIIRTFEPCATPIPTLKDELLVNGNTDLSSPALPSPSDPVAPVVESHDRLAMIEPVRHRHHASPGSLSIPARTRFGMATRASRAGGVQPGVTSD